ncbi:MAG TPA: hypothetical protein VEL76_15720 [Gemmataceae bacterium]|nr:hypothetical protein [Gemmataceae bacterium]
MRSNKVTKCWRDTKRPPRRRFVLDNLGVDEAFTSSLSRKRAPLGTMRFMPSQYSAVSLSQPSSLKWMKG